MKKRLLSIAIISISVIFMAPILASAMGNTHANEAASNVQLTDAEGNPIPPADGQASLPEVAAPVAAGKVPQAQLDYMQKREAAKQRRNELMKLRQQNIESMNQGSDPVDTLNQ